MLRVLAISGKRYSGKDTFAGALVAAAERTGRVLPTFAFAAESKRMFAAKHPEVDLARLVGDRAYKEAWRPQLTAFTVESIAKDPLVFCRAVFDRIFAGGVPALITDLRLVLEVEHLRPRCALHVIRIARTDAERTAAGWVATPGVDDHHTETELDDPARWDRVVENSGSIANLGTIADAIIAELLLPS